MDKQNKWAFIVNPVAGNGFGKTIVAELREQAAKHKIDPEILFTERSGHASALAEDYYKKGFTHIIGVGGDGTMNEIAKTLADRPDVITGLIPAGTGNDFIQILGFHNRFDEKEWDSFFAAKVKAIDAGMCNGMIFLNGMGLGFDAQVAAENYTSPGEVKKGGKHKYIWHIVKTLLFFREKRMKVITGEDSNETDCFINTIAIGRRFAGGFFLTPRAIADDGLLDVCMIKKLNLAERFSILLMVPKGTHITDRRINYYQTPGLTIEFTEEVPFHVDGELYFSKRFDVSIRPHALKMIYNPDGNHFFRK